MGKVALAGRLADEFGSSIDNARRFVDDVGPDSARSLLDDAGSATDNALSSWRRPLAIAGGAGAVAGGGALAFNQQDVQEARQIAETTNDKKTAIQRIIESDMSPEAKQAALESLGANTDQGDDSGDGPLPDNPQVLIVMVIVLIFVLKFSLEGDE